MTQILVQLNDEMLQQVQAEATQQNRSVDDLIKLALAQYLEENTPSKAEVMAGFRSGMLEALTGQTRPAHEVLDEIERETNDYDD